MVAGEKEESSDEEEAMEDPKVKLSTPQICINTLIDCSCCSQLPEMAHYSWNLRMIKELMIKERHLGVAKQNH